MPYTSRQKTGIDTSMANKRWPWQSSSTYGSFYNREWSRIPLYLLPYYGGYDRYWRPNYDSQNITSLDYGKFYMPSTEYLAKTRYLKGQPRYKYGLSPAHEWSNQREYPISNSQEKLLKGNEVNHQSPYRFAKHSLDSYHTKNESHLGTGINRLPDIYDHSPYYKPFSPPHEDLSGSRYLTEKPARAPQGQIQSDRIRDTGHLPLIHQNQMSYQPTIPNEKKLNTFAHLNNTYR